MLRHNALRAALVGATMTALAAFGTGAASAAGIQSASSSNCIITGYVCVTVEPTEANPSGNVLIPQGTSYTFDSPTEVTSITNETSLMYCVSAESRIAVAPGEYIEETHTVTKVAVAVESSGCFA
ncbi:hypothetical protein ABT127_07655 [Streptomyces sp. NPDC001904]|uniref:hypothetical protein n=1 Tax=Streptomyces sp. NPDC001904 TaxID=3154531 RepID=UPI00331D83F4